MLRFETKLLWECRFTRKYMKKRQERSLISNKYSAMDTWPDIFDNTGLNTTQSKSEFGIEEK